MLMLLLVRLLYKKMLKLYVQKYTTMYHYYPYKNYKIKIISPFKLKFAYYVLCTYVKIRARQPVKEVH